MEEKNIVDIHPQAEQMKTEELKSKIHQGWSMTIQ